MRRRIRKLGDLLAFQPNVVKLTLDNLRLLHIDRSPSWLPFLTARLYYGKVYSL